MKLTRKGLLKIVGDIVVNSPEFPLSETLDNWNRARDFDQDDFEGVVILTVEEAKEIANFFGAVDACTNLKLTKEEQKAWNKLTKRIEQAEVAKIGEDYNKALNKVVEEFQKQAEGKDEAE